MTIKHRQIIAARRIVGNSVATSLREFEDRSHESALAGARCVASALEAHDQAFLPKGTGMEILDLLSDAARHASLSRAKIGAAHDKLRELSQTHSIPFASDPECPPNTGQGVAETRARA